MEWLLLAIFGGFVATAKKPAATTTTPTSTPTPSPAPAPSPAPSTTPTTTPASSTPNPWQFALSGAQASYGTDVTVADYAAAAAASTWGTTINETVKVDLGFGKEPTLVWDQLTQEQIKAFYPAYIESVGYADTAKGALFFNATNNTNPHWWMGGFAFPGTTGKTVAAWLWGPSTDPAHAAWNEPYLQRRHVHALYLKALGVYKSLADYQADWAATIGNGGWVPDLTTTSVHDKQRNGLAPPDQNVYVLDPRIEDDLGSTLNPPVLSSADFKLGYYQYTQACVEWLGREGTRETALCQIEKQLMSAMDAENSNNLGLFLKNALNVVADIVTGNYVGAFAGQAMAMVGEAQAAAQQQGYIGQLQGKAEVAATPVPSPATNGDNYAQWSGFLGQHFGGVNLVIIRAFRASKDLDDLIGMYKATMKKINESYGNPLGATP